MASLVNMCFMKMLPNSFSRFLSHSCLRPDLIKFSRCASSLSLSRKAKNIHDSAFSPVSNNVNVSSLLYPTGIFPSCLVICGNISSGCGSCVQTRSYSSQKPGLAEEVLKSKLPPSPPPTEASSGAEQPKEKKDSWFSGKNAWKLGLASLAVMGVFMCGNILFLWGRPLNDPEGNEMVDEFTDLPKYQAYPKRAWKEMQIFKKMIQEPSSLKLLPDALKDPWYQPPYTLVLEMTGVLVHPDWTLNTGWRFKKRPGLDYFLQQVGPPLFEVVIYTREQGLTAFPIIDGLDPEGRITFRLFRDATRYVNGAHVKDLACLNRDLSKVIIVDCDPKSFSLQPQNAFLLKKWNGDDSDRTLVDLAAFLRTIAVSNVEDVRTVLEYYGQFEDPIGAFKEKQRILQEQEEQLRATATQKSQKPIAGGWSFGFSGLRKS